jgi:16S rRNA (cytidine1402-2'-O)-methyltransferase
LERRQNFQNTNATLYLIPTPIGNLGDITFRSVETMKTVQILYAEDTRVTRKLLTHFEIKTELKSYHEHNKTSQTDVILSELQLGKNIGLCSDAGMPLISDPGFEIAEAAFQAGFNVVALPGASAGLTGLLMSGFRAHPHLFYGFLDPKSGKRQTELERLKTAPETMIFYEAPHRIKDTLQDVWKVFGDRRAVIAREITKKFEEIIRGRLSELTAIPELQGEIVLIVEGYDGTSEVKSEIPLAKQVDDWIALGMSKSDAMKKVAAAMGLTKSVVYKEYLQNQK